MKGRRDTESIFCIIVVNVVNFCVKNIINSAFLKKKGHEIVWNL